MFFLLYAIFSLLSMVRWSLRGGGRAETTSSAPVTVLLSQLDVLEEPAEFRDAMIELRLVLKGA